MLVKNLRSNAGRAVPNQFAIEADGKGSPVYFQSYESICAKVTTEVVRYEKTVNAYTGLEYRKPVIDKVLTLGKDWNYSKTTARWLRAFLREYCYKYCDKTEKDFRKLMEIGEVRFDAEM